MSLYGQKCKRTKASKIQYITGGSYAHFVSLSRSLLPSKSATPKLRTNTTLGVDVSCVPDRNRLQRVLCYAYETALDLNTPQRTTKLKCNFLHASQFFLKESNILSASHDISWNLLGSNIYNRIQNIPQLVSIQSHKNSISNLLVFFINPLNTELNPICQ